MKEIRAAARERMKGHCRVCPVCDGKACSGEVPGMGGLGTGASFRNNREALNACKLNMTALHDAREPRTNCTILGIDLSFPVMAAPIGGVSFNMSDAMSEDDYIFAILEGSRAAGVIGCTGDGVPPFIIDAAVKALKAAAHVELPRGLQRPRHPLHQALGRQGTVRKDRPRAGRRQPHPGRGRGRRRSHHPAQDGPPGHAHVRDGTGDRGALCA